MKNPVVVGMCLLAFLIVNQPPSAAQTADSATQSRTSDVLIIVDLSHSLSPEEKKQIPAITQMILQHLAPGSHFETYVLKTDMGNQGSLARGDIGDPVNRLAKRQALLLQRHWIDEIEKGIAAELSREPQTLTSCYLSSMGFADHYFNDHTQSTSLRKVYWIGDMIEDCPDSTYRPLRIATLAPHGTHRHFDKVALGPLQGSLVHLNNVDLLGALIPAGHETEVGASTIFSFWQELAPRFLNHPKNILIRAPERLFLP